jgi:23S rRNA (cytosine1962-C5)-methyltransferase
VRHWSKGQRMVNLFAYTGAFSIYALAGGATRAVDVDAAEPALRDAARHASMNGFSERHSTLAVDLLENPSAALAHPDLRGASMIILDPPSLARRENQRHAALRAYRKLNAAAMAALPAGGLLATASCTAQVSPDAFRQAVAEAAASAGVEARILHEAGHAPDHPVPLSFPEGRYLKFLLLRVDPAR